MIDRSEFLDELRRNPQLMHRIAVITAGEVGGERAGLEKQLIQAETIFNRAQIRGHTLEQVMRQSGQRYSDGKGGYYPRTTLDHGEQIMSRPGVEDRFREQVLKPVLAGSDKGTEKLGFAPTGNASAGTAAERARYSGSFAQYQINQGEYTKHAWIGDPNSGEVYVQHRGENDARIKRTGAQPANAELPAAATSGPGTVTPTAEPQVTPTGTLAASMVNPPVGDRPFEPTNEEQQALVAGGVAAPSVEPLPQPAPTIASRPDIIAPVGAPGDPRRAELPGYKPGAASARPSGQPGQPGRPSLGGAMASMYVDPNTGHRILNPAGSGEQAMGLTRDLGPAAVSRGTSAPKPAAASPPGRASAAPPAQPNWRQATGAPPPQTAAPETPMPAARAAPDILAPLGGGQQDARLGLSPFSPTASLDSGTMFDVKPIADVGMPELTGLKSITPGQQPGPVQPAGPVNPGASARPPFAVPPNLTTQLNPADELGFRSWAQQNKVPFDVNAKGPTDYDMRGFYQRLGQGDPLAKSGVDPTDNRIHYPDIWKTPAHASVSDQSMFATPGAPEWKGSYSTGWTEPLARPSGRLANPPPSPMDRALTPPNVFPRAPEEARSLAAPNAPPGPSPRPGPENAPDPFSGGGKPLSMPMPATVGQQLGGLSPFKEAQPGGPSPTDLMAGPGLSQPGANRFASPGLLPFQPPPWQWDFGGGGWGDSFGFGGGGGFAPMSFDFGAFA